MKLRERLGLDATQASHVVSVILAVLVAVLIDVAVAKKYTRWDLTANKRFSLSSATVQTLRALPDTVQVWVLVGSADPIEQSVKQLLVAYEAETTKLDVHYVDPDRDTVALEDVKKRFSIETGRTEEGHLVADAVVVVAHGDKHWFLTTSDMLEATSGDEMRVKPKEEQAFTGAIRNVLGGDKTRLCFTSGHGEMSPDDESEVGAGTLKDVLSKDNYEVVVVDVGAPNVADPFGTAKCNVAVVAGMRGAFAKEETERLRSYVLQGGNLLVAASPIPGDGPTGLTGSGLDRALAPFGLSLDDDLVVEQDPELAFPGAVPVRFVATARAHPLMTGLVKAEGRDVPRTVVNFTRSLHHTSEPGAAVAVDLLVSSPSAFGLASVAGAADWKGAPSKGAGDLPGPLVLAMAAERPKVTPGAPHGPRAVVIGTASPLTSASFREPLPVRGAAILVENAVSWLASKPEVLDVPERAAVAAGMRITDDARSEIRTYVLLFMPGAVALLGIAVGLWRRSSEGKPRKGEAKTKKKKS